MTNNPVQQVIPPEPDSPGAADSKIIELLQKVGLCPVVLSEPDAASYIGMSVQFLRQDRMNGVRHNRTVGPPFVKIGRSVRYLIDDLDSWLQDHRISRAGQGRG